MYQVKIVNENLVLVCEAGRSLYALLCEHHLMDAPCGGKGICGKCRAKVNDVSVLTCLYTVHSNIEVTLPSKTTVSEIISTGYCKAFNADKYAYGQYGVAIDIGTTTVVATLVSLWDGNELASLSCLNSQKSCGQDVITRIHYTIENTNGLNSLQTLILEDLKRLITGLLEQSSVTPEQIQQIVIGGNTTMIHLLLGCDPKGIASSPYTPLIKHAVSIKASLLGLPVGEDCSVYCISPISAFVGGDITAGIISCDLDKVTSTTLFIDIGTNGEIVLSHNRKLYCCSCAAGPALEGMNISCGVRASNGAIEEVLVEGEKVRYKTIGNQAPIGLCGSGLLLAVTELRRNGLLHASGRLLPHALIQKVEGNKCFVIDSLHNIYLTQKDIRQVQLAKGAILSGIYSLLSASGLEIEEVERVVVAGQFGAKLQASCLTGAGLIPKEWENKIEYVGNTSKSGAYICLMSQEERIRSENLVSSIEYIELSTLAGYENSFIQCLNFEW